MHVAREQQRRFYNARRGGRTPARATGPGHIQRTNAVAGRSREATSLHLSDRRRRRRRRRLLLRELVAELVNLARRRRELLRSQAAKTGGGGDHRRHCRQYFSGDAVLRGGTQGK